MRHNPPLYDLAINLACVALGYYAAFRASWKGEQPSNQLYVAIGVFVTSILWYLTCTFMHVRFLPIFEGSGTTLEGAWRFLFASVGAALYALYLFSTGKAKACDE